MKEYQIGDGKVAENSLRIITLVLNKDSYILFCPLLSSKVKMNATECYEPMMVSTKSMCEEKSPTVSIITPLHAHILSDTVSSIEDSIGCAQDQRIEEAQIFLYIATALDPRFKEVVP